MSLFDGLLLDEPVPSPRPAAVVEIPYTVTIKRASNGDEIMLCSVSPPPSWAIAEASRNKMELFTLDEIESMRRISVADSRALDTIIATRRLMGWGGPIRYQETA